VQNIIPVKIRPHLIPFFYKEFRGVEAYYLNKKVKACKINITSSIGKMFKITLEKAGFPEKIDKFNIYISVSERNSSTEKFEAKIYKCVSGKYAFLKVPEKVANDINDILEDQFRIAFVARVSGALQYAPSITVKEVIEDFMIEYKLDEYGYQLRSLRTLYNRSINKGALLSRMQSKFSNRVLNYAF